MNVIEQQKRGIPFVFQHGLGANTNQTVELLEHLQGIDLVSMDCPGHGTSPLDGVIPSFNTYTDILGAFIDESQIGKAVFGGISMGSGIALNMAIRYPSRVSGLVLIRPAWLDEKNPSNLQLILRAAEAILHSGKEAFEKITEFRELAYALPAAAESLLGVFDASQQKDISFVLKSMVNDAPFAMKALDKITVPCLIIGNHDDPLHPVNVAEVIHEKIQGSELVIVPSRYTNNQKHTEAVREQVLKFIMKNEKHLE